ncbi:hypothetical protein TNCT_398121 [Trichonephila clavata]|uniref:C2H2-type domain-containing protein n=1 Tax=Trichonephila clavata TaxID=2740835 RepID=A0A8X6LAY2_TRICU|nr:hypothetical protein TNCT_398121 [Trichonephila clavata]
MNTASGSTISSPSPVALRTRTALADLQDALKDKKCIICGLVLNDLNELRAHILSHPTGAKRRQALCFLDRLIHSPIMVSTSACVPPVQTPRTSPVPVPETGSPDETFPGSETINPQTTRMDTEDTPVTPRSKLNQRLQLVRFSPSPSSGPTILRFASPPP